MTTLLFIAIAAAASQAALISVADPASYSNAIAAAEANDTILLEAGTYPDVQAPANADGTLEQPIVVKARTPGTVVFESYGEGLRHAPKHWVYEGIHFQGHDSYHLFHLKPG